MESEWNIWVWLVGVVSRRWVWLVGVGGIYGCGYKGVVVRRYIDSLILLLLYLLIFAAASLLFVHFVKCFSFFHL